MIDKETFIRLNKMSEICDNLSKLSEEHYRDLLKEIDYIYDEIDKILHYREPDNEKKKAEIIFDGECWRINKYDKKDKLVGETVFNTLIGYPANYVDEKIIGRIEELTSQNYEVSYEYKIKGE